MLFYLYVYILDGEEVYFYASDRKDADKQYVEKFKKDPEKFLVRRNA